VNTAYSRDAAKTSADMIRSRIGDSAPDIAIILGSGLGGLADEIEDAVRVPFADIPGFPEPTVIGHAGALVAGKLSGRRVITLAGRFHMYEGHPAVLAGFPVRVLHALGARTLFASNAAGGIRRDLDAGDLMIIEDHLNLTFRNPLIGALQEGDERFPDMSEPYDSRLRALLLAAGDTVDVPLKSGIYAWLTGPSFETRAEVKMLATLGADAVGMSHRCSRGRCPRCKELSVGCAHLCCGAAVGEVIQRTAPATDCGRARDGRVHIVYRNTN